MKRTLHFLAIAACSSAILTSASEKKDSPVPLPRAHAHNDYEHKRPLLDALDHGFCSVEADIYLVEGQLLVAHDRDKVSPERTIQKLYLDPLLQRAQQNGGRIYRGGPTVTLLVDIKSDAEATYRVLREVLSQYAGMLCAFSPRSMKTNAVLVVVSGNRPRKMMETEGLRYAALDGRLEDLSGEASNHFIPLISDNWTHHFRWRGLGPFPDEERRKLRDIVAKAHAQGRTLRLWATPDRAAAWKELLAAGVDFINTDDLPGLRAFLLKNDQHAAP
ncbi:MAG: hypothetical protein HY735_13570 [Verrucomicrobia bacterium]|nr:hypothetical protein [Verrucomicrobiota bacterium]